MFETKRLIIRKLREDDLNDLYEIFSDSESMKYYPSPFSMERCIRWIRWNVDNYKKYNFGLWAVVLKKNNKCIGDCGITMQNIDGKLLPEIGFHIHKAFTNCGYATEAANVCLDYAFNKINLNEIYCYQKYTNIPSQKTALKLGLKFIKKYEDEKNEYSTVYSITKDEFLSMQL